MSVGLIILIVALILFLLAAINWPQPNPISLGWLGLFFLTIYFLIGK